ncbi:MAG: CotH kinase family protein [Bacteroidaceae bacterium]|nr:CotH kinase family protein [Bacteroidaceae bacterium]
MRSHVLITVLLSLAAFSGKAQRERYDADTLGQIIITTETPLNAQTKMPAHMSAGNFDGPIGIKLRGNSSLSFNQKKYTIELRDDYGHDIDVPLFGMPSHSDWVLLAPYNDVSAVRDPLAFHLWREMGHWAPRTRMVELTLDGEYRGIYILSESIKRDANRVNIAKMKKKNLSKHDLTGGYILRIDTYDEDDAIFPSKVPGIGEGIVTSQITWSCIYPKKKRIQPEQLAYIEQYVDSVELTIQSDYFADPKRGYAHLIDVPSFVDYFIHTELSLNADGYKRSAYFYKENRNPDGSGGLLVAGPVWDYNLAYGICNFCNADNPEAWCFEGGNTQPTPAMWQRLLQDPAFRRAVKVRYKALRKGVLSNSSINSYIDRHAKLLAPYIEHHLKTYPELLVSDKKIQQGKKHSLKAPKATTKYPHDAILMKPGYGFPMFPQGGFPIPSPYAFNYPGYYPMAGGAQAQEDSVRQITPFTPFGGFQPMGGGYDMTQGFGGDAISWFMAYRVSSYKEEIKVLKKWIANRLAFLDRNIDRFDRGWEPHIQEPQIIEMPKFDGASPFPVFPFPKLPFQ